MSSQNWCENLILRWESWLPVLAMCSIMDLIISSKKNLTPRERKPYTSCYIELKNIIKNQNTYDTAIKRDRELLAIHYSPKLKSIHILQS